MKKLTFNFFDCEHPGDLEWYRNDLIKSGARIISQSINYDAEECTIVAEIDDKETFLKAFIETDSYGAADSIY
jgi:hypothetical protein